MGTESYTGLFLPTDEEGFVGLVCKNLENGGHTCRSISAADYVGRCRAEWLSCEKDEVFAFKLLIDRLIQDTTPSPFDSIKSPECVDLVEGPAEDLYCVAIGLIDPDGNLIGAPPGYSNRPPVKGNRAVLLAVTGSVPFSEPEEPAVLPHVMALFDVLGFSAQLASIGSRRMLALYEELIQVALKPHADDGQWTPLLMPTSKEGEYHPGMFCLPIRHAHFSDSILLWIPYDPNYVGPFLDRCLNVFCEALRLGFPLRGAITAGDVVLHKKTSIYLGDPIIEAVKLEHAQDWIGVSFGVSVRSESLRLPFMPHHVMLSATPMKTNPNEDNAALLSGLVLDWPRRWREKHACSARERIAELRCEGFEKYYDNAALFIDHSDANPEWFLSQMPPPTGRGG